MLFAMSSVARESRGTYALCPIVVLILMVGGEGVG